jgi:hypothetical protein
VADVTLVTLELEDYEVQSLQAVLRYFLLATLPKDELLEAYRTTLPKLEEAA